MYGQATAEKVLILRVAQRNSKFYGMTAMAQASRSFFGGSVCFVSLIDGWDACEPHRKLRPSNFFCLGHGVRSGQLVLGMYYLRLLEELDGKGRRASAVLHLLPSNYGVATSN